MLTWHLAALAVCSATVWAQPGAAHERMAEHTLPGLDLGAHQYLSEDACMEHCVAFEGDEPCRAAVYTTTDQMCRLRSADHTEAMRVGLASARHGFFVLYAASAEHEDEAAAAPVPAPDDAADGTSANPDAAVEAFNDNAYATAEELAALSLEYSEDVHSEDVDVYAATGQALAEAEAAAETSDDISNLLGAVVDSIDEDAALLAAHDAMLEPVREWDSRTDESIEDRLADLNDLSPADETQFEEAALEILEELEGPSTRRALLQAATPAGGCTRETAKLKWTAGGELSDFPGTESDAACFELCRSAAGCSLSIRNPAGGCFLRTGKYKKDLADSGELNSSYCAEGGAGPILEDCESQTEKLKWTPGDNLDDFPGTANDAECFDHCRRNAACTLSIRAPNGGCFLRSNKGPADLQRSGDLSSTYCKRDLAPLCDTTTAVKSWAAGDDIAHYPGTKDNLACFRKCAAFPGCKMSIRAPNGNCFLRKEGPASLARSNELETTYCTSDAVDNTPDPPANICATTTDSDRWAPGLDIAHYGGMKTNKECFAKCAAFPGCKLSIRNAQDGCFLRAEGPDKLIDGPGLTSTYCTSDAPNTPDPDPPVNLCATTTDSDRWAPGLDIAHYGGMKTNKECFAKCAAFPGCKLSIRNAQNGCFLRAEGPDKLIDGPGLTSTYCTSDKPTTQPEKPTTQPENENLCGGGQCNNKLQCPADTAPNTPMRFTPNLVRFTDFRSIKLSVIVVPSGPGTISRVRCTQIGPLRSDVSAFQVENKQCSEGGFPLSNPISAGKPLVVAFDPGSFVGAVSAFLELLDSSSNLLGRVPVMGVGGNIFPAGHTAHPIPSSASVHIAPPGQSSVSVDINGSGSHSHAGRSLVTHRWTHMNTGKVRTETDFNCVHKLGTHAYKLDVQDNKQPIGTIAGDFMSFAVAPSSDIPGTLVEALNAKGQPVFADMLTANSFEVNDALIMSDFTRIRFSGKVALSAGDKLTWYGCAGAPSVSLNNQAVARSGNSFTVPSSGTKNLKFTCTRSGRLTGVKANNLPLEFPSVDVADSKPTLNRLQTTTSTRPLARGVLTGFYLGEGSLKMYNDAESYTVQIQEQDAVSVTFTYPAPRAGGLFKLQFQSSSGTSNSVSVTVTELASQAPTYTQQGNLSPSVAAPAAGVYCHGKLYVANVGLKEGRGSSSFNSEGYIYEYTLDANYKVKSWKLVVSVGEQKGGTPSRTILGLTCDPWDKSDNYKLYFSRSHLFAYGTSGNQINQKADYSGYVSYVEPLKSTCNQKTSEAYSANKNCSLPPIQDVISGLPVSNYDHAVNGLQFTHSGSLLVCIGSATNAGAPGPSLRWMPESPLSGAIVEFDLHRMPKPLNIKYDWLSGIPGSKRNGRDSNDARYGPWVKVGSAYAPYINVLYSGLRNPWDATVTTAGEIHFTVSGPNDGFGDKMTGVNSNGDLVNNQEGKFQPRAQDMVVMNAPKEGCHGGHSNQAICNFDKFERNINSGSNQMCKWVSAVDTSTSNHCATKARRSSSSSSVFTLTSALGSVMEFSSQVFGGTVHQHRYIPRYKQYTTRCEKRRPDVCVRDSSAGGDQGYPESPGLTVLALPGGVHCGISYADSNASRYRVWMNRPTRTPAGAQAWDVFPDRAPQRSGGRINFEIGGKDFPASGMYATFGSSAQVPLKTTDGNTRLRGVIPDSGTQGLVDVSVYQTGVGQIGVLPKMFYFLTTNPSV